MTVDEKPGECFLSSLSSFVILEIRPTVRPRLIWGFRKSPAPARHPLLRAESATAPPFICGGPQNDFHGKLLNVIFFRRRAAAPRLFCSLMGAAFRHREVDGTFGIRPGYDGNSKQCSIQQATLSRPSHIHTLLESHNGNEPLALVQHGARHFHPWRAADNIITQSVGPTQRNADRAVRKQGKMTFKKRQ